MYEKKIRKPKELGNSFFGVRSPVPNEKSNSGSSYVPTLLSNFITLISCIFPSKDIWSIASEDREKDGAAEGLRKLKVQIEVTSKQFTGCPYLNL